MIHFTLFYCFLSKSLEYIVAWPGFSWLALDCSPVAELCKDSSVFQFSHQLHVLHKGGDRSNFLPKGVLMERFTLDCVQNNCCCEPTETLHTIQVVNITTETKEKRVLSLKSSNWSQLIEACQVSAEDLGFLVATLSPSLRHIPAASTHLPKINCTALTPSSQPSALNVHTIQLNNTKYKVSQYSLKGEETELKQYFFSPFWPNVCVYVI